MNLSYLNSDIPGELKLIAMFVRQAFFTFVGITFVAKHFIP